MYIYIYINIYIYVYICTYIYIYIFQNAVLYVPKLLPFSCVLFSHLLHCLFNSFWRREVL